MSYLNRTEDPRPRNAAIVAVIAIHAVVGYGLVTGLTFTKLIDQINNPDGILVDDVPLPPPTPIETPEPQQETVTYIAPDPRPPLDLNQDPSPRPEVIETDHTAVSLYPDNRAAEFPPAQPPTPSFPPKRAVPRNNSSNWITNDDYPRRALVDAAEGSVGYRLIVSTAGRVASCELTRPSGNRALDDATCRLITSRARFEPATDETGAKVLGSFTGSVSWQIPD